MSFLGECAQCRLLKVISKSREFGLNLCRTCKDTLNYWNKKGFDQCSICPRFARVAIRKDGKPICQSCYRINFAPRNLCVGCKQIKPLLSSYKGIKLCSTCRSKRRIRDESLFEVCVSCGINKPVATRNLEAKAICYSCYMRGFRD